MKNHVTRTSIVSTSAIELSRRLEEGYAKTTVVWYVAKEAALDIADSVANDIRLIANIAALRCKIPLAVMERVTHYMMRTIAWSICTQFRPTVYTEFITIKQDELVLAESFYKELRLSAKTRYMAPALGENVYVWGEVRIGCGIDARKLVTTPSWKTEISKMLEEYGIDCVDNVWDTVSRCLRDTLLQRGILHCPDCVMTLTTAQDKHAPVLGIHYVTQPIEYELQSAVKAFRHQILRQNVKVEKVDLWETVKEIKTRDSRLSAKKEVLRDLASDVLASVKEDEGLL